MQFDIVTDSSCNLLDEMIEEFGLHILPLTFMSDGEQFQSYTQGEKSDLQRFYTMMREGKIFTTSLPNQQDSEKLLHQILANGRDILYIGFSSGLSGTYEATAGMLDAMRSEFPTRKIFHVDTRGASMGEGLLVYKAACMARDGATIEETHGWVEANKFNLAHWFTVDDLMYLFRGGRVSRTSAWAGSLLNIKPVLHMDNAGHLIPMEKVRGRRKSIQALFEHMKESAIQPVSDQTVFISHGDCEEDANYLADMIRDKLGVTDIRINYVDPVIGAHSGPGTLALFFLADKR
ncbi:MAG: DegV family protein [Eggerthellaceae bacterium]|nr:DegV family protein [Eggerthellaceae bacterium]